MKKKKIFTLLLFVLAFGHVANAQLMTAFFAFTAIKSAISKSIPDYTHGIVLFNDGHEQEYLWVELPKDKQKKLRVSDDEKHRKTKKIAASDIKSVTYWTDQVPTPLTLSYIQGKRKRQAAFCYTAKHAWGYPIASSKWGTVYKCNTDYDLDKKTGGILRIYNTTSDGNHNTTTVGAPCYLVCSKVKTPQMIGNSSSKIHVMSFDSNLDKVAESFKSNSKMKKMILKGEMDGPDIQYILDDMAIYHKLSTEPATPINLFPVVETPTAESTDNNHINGTVGDDE